MRLATIFPGRSVRILVNRRLATRGRTCVNGRGDGQCSRHRVTPLRRVSVPVAVIPIGVPVPVSVSVLSTIRL